MKGKTEQIINNLNPDFQTRICMNYFFEKSQDLKFVMIDGDGNGDYDVIGEITTTMGGVMGAKAQVLQKELMKDGKKCGQINVRAEAIQESNETAYFQFAWSSINNVVPGCMDNCPESHRVYFTISRRTQAGSFV